MHELAIAQEIVRTVLSEMERQRASSVRSIDVEIGQLEGLREDDIVRAFRLEATGTPLESAILDISIVPAVAFCPSCDASKSFDVTLTRMHDVAEAVCPDCGADLTFRGGRGVVVRAAAMVLNEA